MRTLQQTGLMQLAIGAFLGSLAAFCLLEPSANTWAAAQSADIPNRESTAQEELGLIRGKLPDQAHAMMDVGYQFSNLWFAAKAENWPLADFYFKETKSHLNWAVRIIPVRKDNAGQEIDLKAILQALENSPLKQVEESLAAKDVQAFERAYRFTLEGCYACHKASDKPFIRPQVPSTPAATIINFDPDAKWPQ
jgi:hypothetical protein